MGMTQQLCPAELWDGKDWRIVHPLHLSESQFTHWLQLQRTAPDGGRRSIGGTAAAAILGKSSWRTPAQVWDFIMRLAPDTYNPEAGGYAERGIVLEPHIANLYTRKTQRSLLQPNRGFPYVHRAHDFLTANPDFFIDDLVGKGILEIKTMYPDKLRDIKDNGVSDEFAIQLQHYLDVMNLSWGSFACFNADNWELYVIDVKRDDAFINDVMRPRLVAFWNDFVLTRTRPPELIASPEPINVPQAGGEAVDKSSDVEWVNATTAYASAKEQEALAKHAVELAKKRVMDLMVRDDASRVIINGNKFQWEPAQGASYFDVDALVRAYPFVNPEHFTARRAETRPFNFWPHKTKRRGDRT